MKKYTAVHKYYVMNTDGSWDFHFEFTGTVFAASLADAELLFQVLKTNYQEVWMTIEEV